MAYATPKDLENFFGQSRLRDWYSHMGESELEASYLRAVNSASARMNGVFSRSGYTVPVDPSLLANPDLATQLTEQLREVCCALAISAGIGGNVKPPEGAEEQVRQAEAWLKSILKGDESILGFVRGQEPAREMLAGRIGFVGTGEEIAIPHEEFEMFRFGFLRRGM